MAQTKLTLRLDADLISRAKASAAKQGKSLSQIVADYFAALVGSPRRPRRKRPDRDALPPNTRHLCGLLEGEMLDRSAYLRHLEEKHR
ncbi:MAG: antitoxin [Phycisphaeraceae bacterium]|nr:MAG: antitoxin [Phycisphaeraceae bacterium]